MTILLLTHSYPDINKSWRGTFIKEQAQALARFHNVIVVFFKVDNGKFAPFAKYRYSKTETGNVTVYSVTISKSLPVLNQINYLLKTYRFIVTQILPKSKPDVIHSHLSYPAGFLGTIIQKKKGIPGLVTEHSRIQTYFRSLIHKQAVLYTLKNASGIVTVSNVLKNEIVALHSREVYVVNNIVDTGRFRLNKSKKAGKVNIGFLGGLGNNNKGLDILLKAAALIRDGNFIFHIGGAGSLLADYKRQSEELGIDKNCDFYGEILPADVPAFFNKLDIFVLPSRYETFGIVVIEAMASGIPVVATRCGGPEEIVTQATGLLIEKENPGMLADAILKISTNLEYYNGDVIRRYAEINFGRNVFIEKITQVYNKLLTGQTTSKSD